MMDSVWRSAVCKIGAVLSLTVAARLAPPVLVVYVFMGWTLVLLTLRQQIFGSWLVYSVVFWALSVDPQTSNGGSTDEHDSHAFLAIATIAQGGLLVVDSMRPHALENQLLRAALPLLLFVPIHCNNMLQAPLLAYVRVALHIAVDVLDRRRKTWVTLEYPLFSKIEVLPFLLAVHVLVRLLKPAPQLPSPPPKTIAAETPDADSSKNPTRDDDDDTVVIDLGEKTPNGTSVTLNGAASILEETASGASTDADISKLLSLARKSD